jgi:hypothetical protein
MPTKKEEDDLAELLKAEEQLQAKIRDAKAALQERKRKSATTRRVLFGRVIEEHGDDKLKAAVMELARKHATRKDEIAALDDI